MIDSATGRNPLRALTILIPAFCEEKWLARTTEEANSAAARTLDAFEIIIVNDGSTDGTREIADTLVRQHEHVSAIHFPENRGVGAAYRAGLERARYPYISLVPGDRPFETSGLETVFRSVGQADMIISYRSNPAARRPLRRLLSRICTFLLRLTTRCWLRDGHSLYVWPVDLARQIKVPADYSYHLVTLVNLLWRVQTFAEVPVPLTPKPDDQSRVLRWRVVLTLGWRLAMMMLASLRRIGSPKARRVDLAAPGAGRLSERLVAVQAAAPDPE